MLLRRRGSCRNKSVAIDFYRMIPDFTDEGMLPPGIHRATLREVRDKLGWGLRRRDLLDRLEAGLRLMKNCGIDRVYLDGSFVTEKDRPGDIDCCYDVPPGTTNLRMMYPIWPWTSVNRAMSKMLYGAELAPSRAPARASGQPFIEFFQRDRSGRPRGIVLLELISEAL